MLQTLNEAYKVAALQNFKLSPLESIYLITLGNARALSLDGKIGNFQIGKEADFVVIDPRGSNLLNYRIARAKTLEEKLFALTILGSENCVKSVYVYGVQKFNR